MATETGRGMSHALRTPLSAVLMSLDLLSSRADETLRSKLVAPAQTAEAIVEQLKSWSLNSPSPTQVREVGQMLRDLSTQLQPFWESMPPLGNASRRLEELIRVFEWMHPSGALSTAVLGDADFVDGLKLALIHGQKRERIPEIEVQLTRGDRILTVSEWYAVWRTVCECRDRLEQTALESIQPKLNIVLNPQTGVGVEIQGHSHQVPWPNQ